MTQSDVRQSPGKNYRVAPTDNPSVWLVVSDEGDTVGTIALKSGDYVAYDASRFYLGLYPDREEALFAIIGTD
jgi:hypothetical protein